MTPYIQKGIVVLLLFFCVEMIFAPKLYAKVFHEGLIYETPVSFKKIDYRKSSSPLIINHGLSDSLGNGIFLYPRYLSFSLSPTPTKNPFNEKSAIAVNSSFSSFTPTPTPTSLPVVPTENIISPTPLPPIGGEDIWDSLASCESNNNWSIDTGNGYFGGLQFSQSAWESVGGTGNPAHASREEQIAKGKLLQERRGWGAWGACAKKLGLQ